MEEIVVLVDKKNKPIGTAPKSEVHTANTPLHRGFSVFLFNSRGELLLQQRSKKKKTFPLVWSNTCCGHPGVGETPIEAAKRRLKSELGIEVEKIYVVLPDYQYKAEMDGIVENEICPVIIVFSDNLPKPNPDEVENTRWIPWSKFLKESKETHSKYSSWSTEEALLLTNSSIFKQLISQYVLL